MKIRNDFVTNSSSSSFIIGKKDDESVTIESVYQTIRGLYRDYLTKRDMAVQYLAEHPELNLLYVLSEDGKYYFFQTIDNSGMYDVKNEEAINWIEKQFGISMWENFRSEYNWLKCETYDDYVTYWTNRIDTDETKRSYAPFTIADFFEEKEVRMLHYGAHYDVIDRLHKVNSKSDVIRWYYKFIEDYVIGDQIYIKDLIVPEDKACLWLLGRVCIYSEDCYIPFGITDKLEEISEHYCVHMG